MCKNRRLHAILVSKWSFSRLGHPLNWLVSSARCSTSQHKSTNTHQAFCCCWLLNSSRGYDSESLMGEWDGWFLLELGLENTKSSAMNTEIWSLRGESGTLTQPRIRGLYESVMLHSHAFTHTHTPCTLLATTSFSLILLFILHSISFKSSMMLCCNAMFLRRNILLSVI